jgi:hypothetical protein
VLTAVVVVTMLPSIYLAVKLVKEEVFSSKARVFISKELTFEQAHLTERNINPAKKQIEVTLIGDLISKKNLKDIEARMESYGLTGASLLVHQSKDNTVDVTALKSNIVSELYKENLYNLEEKNKTIQNLQAELQGISANKAEWRNISAELHAQYPQIREVLFSEAVQWKVDNDKGNDKQIVLNITASSKLNSNDRYRITEWLKVRIKTDNIKLIID